MDNKEYSSFIKELEDAGVSLVAVSKTRPPADVKKFYDYGHRDFGENYVQELVAKSEELPSDIRWHFIGHLQRNKVKDIAPFVHLIQGVDSERLLKEINKQAVRNNRNIDVLLQLHIAEESSKFGFDKEEVRTLLPHLAMYSHVKVRGLMGMATFTDDMEKAGREFGGLHAFFAECKNNPAAADWDILSTGMSADYEVAIQNGSNMIRIGSLIFGERV